MRDLSHVKATGRQPGTPQHSLEVETGLNGPRVSVVEIWVNRSG